MAARAKTGTARRGARGPTAGDGEGGSGAGENRCVRWRTWLVWPWLEKSAAYAAPTPCETAAADTKSLSAVGVYFELWLLRIAGYLPDWSSCIQCHRKIDETEDVNLASNFHLMCGTCRRTSGSRVIDATHRMIFAATRRLSPQQFVEYTIEMGSHLKDLSQILKRIISHSIGREVTGEISLAVNN